MADLATLNTDRLRGDLRRDEAMARHVSWRAGGAASTTYAPADLADLQCFLRTLPAGEPVFMVGLGSNLLVRDGGLRGTVVFTHRALGRLQLAGQSAGAAEIHVEAGVASPKVARFAALNGLAGAEFLAGVPGTVGGALAMNAGCYGGETWNIVKGVVTVDRRGTLHERTAADFVIGYRTVVAVPAREEWFVAATLHLLRGNAVESRSRIKALLSKRIASQPLGQPNAGSVFRNPPGDHAARLIEACGLKGRAIGGAAISTKHANFIVNLGNARAADIEALIALAQAAVREKFGLTLECEVRIVGDAA